MMNFYLTLGSRNAILQLKKLSVDYLFDKAGPIGINLGLELTLHIIDFL